MDEKKQEQFGLTENEIILDKDEIPAFGLDGKKTDLESLKQLNHDGALELFQTAQINYLMGTGQYESVQIMLEPAIKTTIQNPENYVLYAVKANGQSEPRTRITSMTGKIVSTVVAQ